MQNNIYNFFRLITFEILPTEKQVDGSHDHQGIGSRIALFFSPTLKSRKQYVIEKNAPPQNLAKSAPKCVTLDKKNDFIARFSVLTEKKARLSTNKSNRFPPFDLKF